MELDFFIINEQNFSKLINREKTIYRIFYHAGKNYIVFETDVTEKMVGLSDDDQNVTNVTWELLTEKSHEGKKYLIFEGRGEYMERCADGTPLCMSERDFGNIGIEKHLFANIIANLMAHYPDRYSISDMKNVVGLEGFIFEDGKMWI